MTTRAYTAGSGALVYGVCALESAACTRPAICCLAITSLKKFATVKLIDASMPKMSRRLKDHRQLEQLAQHDPNNKDIYEESIGHTIPRDQSLEDVYLYDLVANYSWQNIDDNGKRQYTKLKKPRLPNHKLFGPQKENREDYFYSLILLFVPFREESSLLLENETAEEAFHRLMNKDSSAYHEKILDALSKMTDQRGQKG